MLWLRPPPKASCDLAITVDDSTVCDADEVKKRQNSLDFSLSLRVVVQERIGAFTRRTVMPNSPQRETAAVRANGASAVDLLTVIYEGKKAGLDRACDEAAQSARASGEVERLEALLLRFDHMTREYRDL